jgi:saccharopine dehydrogenase (NAD+, L-lysine-forming)
LLLQETDVRLALAGRSLERAAAAAAALNRTFEGERVSALYTDAADSTSLNRALKGIDLVVVTSSTAQYAGLVAQAALAAGSDYLDLQYSTRKIALLKSLAHEIEQAGCCFITDGGFHPGLPAALVRYAAPSFHRLDTARVGSVIKVDWASLSVGQATVDELLAEMADFQTLLYRNGKWLSSGPFGMLGAISMDFGREFGRQACVPMLLEEMRCIPELYPTVRETGFFVGGFNWFVDWLVSPLALVALRLWPQAALKPMGRLMHWGLKTFSQPPYGTMLRLEAQGVKGGEATAMAVTLYHADGYAFTAIPVVACLLQVLNGAARKPGLWLQAHLVEPNQLMQDMERLGVVIDVRSWQPATP